MKKIKVSEIFYSLQGEGPNTGKPSLFVRLSGCNLKCKFCDTPYTWDWKNYNKKEEIKLYTPDQLIKEIIQKGGKAQSIVFTGGEPLLQQEELSPVFEKFYYENYSNTETEIETNGTIPLTMNTAKFINKFNISPKLSSSGNKSKIAIFQNYHYFWSKLFFKFVICNQKDLVEVDNIVKEYNINKRSVYLMPEGRNKEEIESKMIWLSNICLEKGYILCNRLQVILWGDQRGK